MGSLCSLAHYVACSSLVDQAGLKLEVTVICLPLLQFYFSVMCIPMLLCAGVCGYVHVCAVVLQVKKGISSSRAGITADTGAENQIQVLWKQCELNH